MPHVKLACGPLAILMCIVVASRASAACPEPLTSEPTDVGKELAIFKLSELLVCSESDPENDQSPCNTFAGRGLETIYSVSDFKTGDGYLSANQMWDFVTTHSRWVDVGNVYDDDNNWCAQTLANRGFPVLALMKASGHGHVAMIIPGAAATSPKWGITAAYSAGFLYHHPEQAYVGGMLSKAFQPDDAKNAEFFYRKFSFDP